MVYGQSSADILIWLLQVDPNGNIMPPIARTTTISWELSNLPQQGNFSIVDYTTGTTVVANMRATASFEVTGTDDQYYNLRWIWAPLAVEPTPVAHPESLGLRGCYPNPFNSSTTIRYQLPAFSQIGLWVYDTTGRLVAISNLGGQAAGEHQIQFDGSNLASGIYLYRLQAGNNSFTSKMVLLK
jgi:hypothetical protein